MALTQVGLDVLDQLVGVEIARVEILRQTNFPAVFSIGCRGIHLGESFGITEVRGATWEQGERTFKATPMWPLMFLHPQVPFPDHVGAVATVSKQRRDGDDAVIEKTLVSRLTYLV